ncbi:MAG TPA: V-type ATP synthase subunit D [Candidatus Fermentibacter daniensis]|nr:V-type ATP synthase subunit D [Candidatus Fermentibacter daniensis]
MAVVVRATRMELQTLRKRSVLARRGHKLLKDKLDELMRQFKILIAEYMGARQKIEGELLEAYREFLFARASMRREALADALRYPGAVAVVHGSTRKVMNLTLPEFDVSMEGSIRNYGMLDTTPELDASLEVFARVLPGIVKLAGQEKAIGILAAEIDRTRRRVNALEYILIPELEEAVSRIRLKLEEIERGNLTRLMKVKKMAERKREGTLL